MHNESIFSFDKMCKISPTCMQLSYISGSKHLTLGAQHLYLSYQIILPIEEWSLCTPIV